CIMDAKFLSIFLTLINEYTDWSRAVEQPINILESMADILSDSLVVSPLIQTGDLHSGPPLTSSIAGAADTTAGAGKTFFYIFTHQNEESVANKLNVKESCSHSVELSYIFGAPLSYHLLGKSMTHFATNYSRAEVTLSEALMTYWINFAKFGIKALLYSSVSATFLVHFLYPIVLGKSFLPVLVDGVVRGNYGLMDQVAALHWIQENIAEFGGQSDNVTIIGYGYGAACAHLLMISPMAKAHNCRII
ncbi:unnamed protein product, partial [Medioppia subpectinata]